MKIKMKNICDVKWSDLEDGDKTYKNCKLCHREVHDFTDKSEEEIIEILKHKKERLCAKILPRHVSNLKKAAAIVLISSTINLGCNNKLNNPAIHQNISTIEMSNDAIIQNTNGKVKISGIVFLENDGEAIGASIIIRNKNIPLSEYSIGTVTEFDGTFYLEGSASEKEYKNLEFLVSYTGYETFSISLEKVNLKNDLIITLRAALIGELMLKEDIKNI